MNETLAVCTHYVPLKFECARCYENIIRQAEYMEKCLEAKARRMQEKELKNYGADSK